MSDQPEAQASLSDRLLLAAGIVLFAIGQSLNFIIVAPLARSTGLTELQFGIAYTLASLPLVFSAPFWGRKSDMLGRKPVFILGLLGSGLGTLALALSLKAGMDGKLSVMMVLIAIILARGFYGVTSSALYPSAAAYMADVTTLEDRGKGMALIGSANSMGSILGPFLAASLTFAGALMPMYVAAGLCVVGAVAAVCLLREPRRTNSSVKRGKSTLKWNDPRLRPFMILWACFFLIFISLNLLTAFYIEDRLGISEKTAVIRTASLALLSMAGVITIVQGVFLQIWRVSPKLLLRLCGPAFCIALLIMAFATNVGMLVGGYAMLGLSFSFATPGINGSASLAMKPEDQGAAAGYLGASNTVGAIFAPVVGTGIYQIAPNAPFLFGAALFFVLSLYALTIKVVDPTRSSAAAPVASQES